MNYVFSEQGQAASFPAFYGSPRAAAKSVALPAAIVGHDALDIPTATLPWLLEVFACFGRLGQTVGSWTGANSFYRIGSGGLDQEVSNLGRSGLIDCIVCDNDGRLVDAFSLRLWGPSGDRLSTRDVNAPIKHRSVIDDGRTPERTDFSFDHPVDAVLTWVNGSDEEWQALISEHAADRTVDFDRYAANDELRFAIRSLCIFAPWVRTIYVLSNCKPPAWFVGTKRIRWVRHEEVCDTRYLPSFNSHGIELMLADIPHLSEHFIYLNDDVMLTKPATPLNFFNADGTTVSHMEVPGRVLEFIDDSQRPEWESAAANGAALIRDKFGMFPTRLHQHVPFALRRSVLNKMMDEFPDEIGRTRLAKFRENTDLSAISFLYHHFSQAMKVNTLRTATSVIVRQNNYRDVQLRVQRGGVYQFICVNDGNGSHSNENYAKFKREFLPRLLPFKAECESRTEEVCGPPFRNIFLKHEAPKPKQQRPVLSWGRRTLHKALIPIVTRNQSPDDQKRFINDPVDFLAKAKFKGNQRLGKLLLRADQRPY